jgi:hypothetical protein
MFAPAQLLHNSCEQRPSNQGGLDSSVTGEVGRVYYTGVDVLLISFLYRSTYVIVTKYMFMSRHQTAGQSNYIRVANKSSEKSGKVQVFRININGPELHS